MAWKVTLHIVECKPPKKNIAGANFVDPGNALTNPGGLVTLDPTDANGLATVVTLDDRPSEFIAIKKLGYKEITRQITILQNNTTVEFCLEDSPTGTRDPTVPTGRNPPPNGCFPVNARVLTPNGYRSIAQVLPGDSILSYDQRRKKITQRVVRKNHKYRPCPIWNVAFTSGWPTLRVTGHHTMLTSRGWCRVDRLSSGDCLRGINGEEFEIRKVIATPETEPVYNLITYGEHNFIVDDFVAHNFTDLRRLKTYWYRLFLDHLRAAPAENLVPA